MKIKIRTRWMISMGLMAVLLLGGCGGVEPEKRDYPLALAWDYDDDGYTIIYGMAKLQEMTEQKKGNGDTPPGLVMKGKSLEEIQTEYAMTQQHYLDLGHVQAVIFSERLLDQPRAYENVLEGMQNNPAIGMNAYVFTTDSLEEVMRLGAEKEDTLGEYLTGIYKNRMSGARNDGVKLEDVYYDWNNEGQITAPPQLKVQEEEVVLCENL